jgi:4-hydroxybutyrate CoA-transferase
MKNWRDEYERKLISAEEAARFVKSGDYVSFTMGREAYAIGLAIASRISELQNVKIFQAFPGYDFGWYEPGWENSFELSIYMPTAISQQMMDDKRCNLEINDILSRSESTSRISDIVITEVSPPDDKGFCSFGASLWNKREHIKRGKLALAEVNENLIRTFGDNFVHVSEIDYFVPHQSTVGLVANGSLAGRELKKSAPYLKDIVEYVSSLIRDGDTLQIGVGRTTEPLLKMGILNGKQDIGWHSEATPPGVVPLVREGIINGRLKTINPGKVIVTSLGGSGKEDMDWINNNPLFWLVDVSYLLDIRTISAHDNMVAINNAVSVDFSGQIASESIGYRIISGSGGQTAFAIGALLSKGGRSITVLPSAAANGKVSRIVPMLEAGTGVTVPRNCADYVVTEYGIAHLRGKSVRKRAQELIAIAHPDFRAELTKEAQRLYWP